MQGDGHHIKIPREPEPLPHRSLMRSAKNSNRSASPRYVSTEYFSYAGGWGNGRGATPSCLSALTACSFSLNLLSLSAGSSVEVVRELFERPNTLTPAQRVVERHWGPGRAVPGAAGICTKFGAKAPCIFSLLRTSFRDAGFRCSPRPRIQWSAMDRGCGRSLRLSGRNGSDCTEAPPLSKGQNL